MKKRILDACCGSRMFWFDKTNKDVIFVDKRREIVEATDSSQKNGKRIININPDIIADFTKLPFENESFYMVVFDPPHMNSLGKNSWMSKKYGRLEDNWQEELRKGFYECMRVLKTNGTLIFKWNETDITVKEIIRIIEHEPLFGHKSGKRSNTHWMAFLK